MEDVLSDWEHLLSYSSPPPPPPPPPATTLTTSYTSHDPFLTVFPPVNHEGLPVAPPLADSHRHDSPSTATSAATTKTSSASPPLPLPTDFHTGDSTIHKHSLYSRSPSPISPLARWIGLAPQLLNSKLVSAFSNASADQRGRLMMTTERLDRSSDRITEMIEHLHQQQHQASTCSRRGMLMAASPGLGACSNTRKSLLE